MQISAKKLSTCLWFDTRPKRRRTSTCRSSRIRKSVTSAATRRMCRARKRARSWSWNSTNGQSFTALNGGPQYKFTEAVSFTGGLRIPGGDRLLLGKLTEEGQEGPCGWLKDKFGVSWQVFPSALPKMLMGPDKAASARVMGAFMKMKKFDLAELTRAFNGENA